MNYTKMTVVELFKLAELLEKAVRKCPEHIDKNKNKEAISKILAEVDTRIIPEMKGENHIWM